MDPFLFDKLKTCSAYISNVFAKAKTIDTAQSQSLIKAFHSAAATNAGIDTAHIIRKEQIGSNGLTAAQ